MMNLGVIPLAVQFAISVASWMIKSRISAAAAAQQAAAEFDYLKSVSDGQLTGIAFEMAKQFPEYPYWEWFRILEDLRDYGALQPGAAAVQPQPLPPGGTLPTEDDKPADNTSTWIIVGAGILILFLLTR